MKQVFLNQRYSGHKINNLLLCNNWKPTLGNSFCFYCKWIISCFGFVIKELESRNDFFVITSQNYFWISCLRNRHKNFVSILLGTYQGVQNIGISSKELTLESKVLGSDVWNCVWNHKSWNQMSRIELESQVMESNVQNWIWNHKSWNQVSGIGTVVMCQVIARL